MDGEALPDSLCFSKMLHNPVPPASRAACYWDGTGWNGMGVRGCLVPHLHQSGK